MAETVGQHGIAAFVNPSNGDALDATVVKANDNTIRTAYVTHDSDGGIHVQSSLIASRPAAGTVGRKWLTTDVGSVKLWYDNGSAWQEISYLTPAYFTTIASSVVPTVTNTFDIGTASLRWRDAFLSGAATITGNVVVGGSVAAASLSGSLAVSSLTGTTLPSSIVASSLTSIGALSSISVSGTAAVGALSSTGAVSGASASITGTISGASVLSTSGQMRANRITQSGAGGTVSFATANHVRHTMTGNGTLTLSGGVTGGVFTVEVLQDATGNRTVAWGSGVVWPGGLIPDRTATANRKDVYTFFFDGTNYLGQQFGANYASTA